MAKNGITYNTHDSATTLQRFEAKYRITELEAIESLDYIAPYLVADTHLNWGDEYVINSLYLDNPALHLYWSSALGEKNRFKLRIRAYTENPDDPVFFEIKRRVDRVILKQRAIIHREWVGPILRGEQITDKAFVRPTTREKENLYQFRDIMETMRAEPRCMVRYLREAYMSSMEEPVRITFDRQLTALPCNEYSPDLWNFGPHWREVHDFPVVLEIKFTNVFPAWITRMVQRFQLRRDSFAKYIACLDSLKRDGIPVAWSSDHNEDLLWSRV